MELNQKQRDAIRDKLNATFNTNNVADCEMCGGESWAIDPYIMELREFAKGGILSGRPVIPLVTMHCMTCGNTKIFNAIALGAIDERTGEVLIDEHAREVVGG